MNRNKFLTTALTLLTAFLLVTCNSRSSEGTMITFSDALMKKRGKLTESEKKYWAHMDIVQDSVPGISLEKAYRLLEGKKGENVIVAIIDSGVDTEHEDLHEALWVNEDEIPGNGIDDDKNGYVDDVHGWNFLGNDEVNLFYVPYEVTREFAAMDTLYAGKTAGEVPASQQEAYAYYLRLKKDFEKRSQRAATNYAALKDRENLEEKLKRQKELYAYETLYGFNLQFHPRKQLGDDLDNLQDIGYGNPKVGPHHEKENHGSHVAGIVGAVKGNGIGIDGVARNAKLMLLRAVPKGDEYDKDIARAIRYAVDNGAKVVNMSFGKPYSPHANWVWEAMRYAQKNDVLLVNAAGNDGKNIDENIYYPTDRVEEAEVVDNLITVGANSWRFGLNLTASFSNYGKRQVDIFAPGADIYSTIGNNAYEFYDGTSMAAPMVSGIATLVRSYYPALTAQQVKRILIDSGLEYTGPVLQPSKDGTFNSVAFATLSASGRIANAYNALLMAGEISKKTP